MIQVTKFNRSQITINATLIETIEATPDTVITLVNGKKFIVLESVAEVISFVDQYYAKVGLMAVQIRQNAEDTDVSK